MSNRYRGILSAMKGRLVQYKCGQVRTNWAWQPGRARRQLAKERRDRERT